MALLIGLTVVTCFAPAVNANDSAASTAVGGLKLIREARVSMLKERLTIRTNMVHVDYEFLNETNADVTTEVAFPIPEYSFEHDDAGGDRNFDDFRVWVEGKPLNYQIDVKAFCKGIDSTTLLQQDGIDISSFGHFDWRSTASPEIAKLSAKQQAELVTAGLIDEYKGPSWSVRKTYYWKQTFPANQVLHVSHEYKPVVGFTLINTGDLDPNLREKRVAEERKAREHDPKSPGWWYVTTADNIERICVEPGLQKQIDSQALAKKLTKEQCGDCAEMVWVDYILTTANTWKTPIKDFELAVDRPKENQRQWYVSLCWDGPVQHPSPDRFVMHMKDFVPERELRIGFLGL